MRALAPFIPKRTLVLFILLMLSLAANAALVADFAVSDGTSGGCSPYKAFFTNKTTGASASAIYRWDFGNGNAPVDRKKDDLVGATYISPKTYTITLTVIDGAVTSSKTLNVTVYQSPTADFTITNTKGCSPLSTSFASSASAGDGTITKYFWDFGDGYTNSGATLSSTTHNYTVVQKSSVTLVVTNSYGCGITVTKNDAVEALGSLTTSFTADKTVLCTLSDAVTFTNNTTGSGTLTYEWDFGDGTTSPDKAPTHTYTQKGIYSIKLTTTTSEGCKNTSSLTDYINAANFISDITMPAAICVNNNAVFTPKTTGTPSTTAWEFSDGYYTFGNYAITKSFAKAGDYTVKLTNLFGQCKDIVEKTFTVRSSPVAKEFQVSNDAKCGAPAPVKFSDSSPDAVKWSWSVQYSVISTDKEPTYTFQNNGTFPVSLVITDASGCQASFTKYVTIEKPEVKISVNNIFDNYTYTCIGFTPTLRAYSPKDPVVNYKWNFGDGGTSTDAEAVHTFSTAGSFYPSLQYETQNGCKGTVQANFIRTSPKPKADFSVSNTTICGNVPVAFINLTTGPYTNYYWLLGDNNSSVYDPLNPGNIGHIYTESGTYNITLIADNNGCRDTMTKPGYLTILPPFTTFKGTQNTCNGTRGEVTFNASFKQATSWSWDYGDGAKETFTQEPTIAKHTYAKSGKYKAVLSSSYNGCTVLTNVNVSVLLKQDVKLEAEQTDLCGSDSLRIHITNPEFDPTITSGTAYYLQRWEYKDGTAFTGPTINTDNIYGSSSWYHTFNGKITGLSAGKQELRVITRSYLFACLDTSNYIPVKVRGPVAGFKILSDNVCLQVPVVYADNTTLGDGVPIKKWEWNFGDLSTPVIKTVNEPVGHIYAAPGSYRATLKVTDADGCVATSASTVNSSVSGPKADFYWSPSNIYPNSTATFINNTIVLGVRDMVYDWSFSAGKYTSAASSNIQRYYPNVLTDTVRLIVLNKNTGCRDTITKYVPVKSVSATFSYTTKYVNNDACPPMVAYFTASTNNVNTVKWLFGDGSSAGNNYYPSHTYNKPGVYKVALIGYGNNGVSDTNYAEITIKGPYATVTSDIQKGCSPVSLNLTADAKNTVSYIWDFGDGTLIQTNDGQATHTYTAPGAYKPSLIMKDDGGCTSSFETNEKIIIDSLHADIKFDKRALCDKDKLLFDIDTYSIAASNNVTDALQQHWDFGTGNIADTANTASGSFTYSATGKYIIKLNMQSIAGCTFNAIDSVVVNPIAKGIITGPGEVCESLPVAFSGSADIIKDVVWRWDFANGKTDDHQTPASVIFNGSATPYEVKLITQYKGCYDTTVKKLNVHFKPLVNLQPKAPAICRGKSIQLSAEDGVQYEWTPVSFLDNAAISKPVASPQISTRYSVKVTNTFGCVNKDSVDVTVAAPFRINVSKDTFVCAGSSVVLRASGAYSYKWISNTTDLSNTQIENPDAKPSADASYTVVGYDAYNCFTDTAVVKVAIKPLPTVNAGADMVLPVGTSANIVARVSANTTQLTWSPADYLSCTNCFMSVAEPRRPITYVATAKTQFGCIAKDSLFIDLRCVGNTVTMPTAFTPDKDGRNDVFYPLGKGIRNIKHFIIFNRWGVPVFEKSNISINDRSTGWNGTYKGDLCPQGSYVYAMEVECDTGESYTVKGTVTLIR